MTSEMIIRFADWPRDYAGLVRAYPLRPVRDPVDADNATEIVDALAGHDLTRDQADYLDVLSTLLEAFENAHDPVRPMRSKKPLANLRHLLDDHEMSASDLGRVLGNRALGSKILRGERRLGLTHIKKLMKYFAVDASAFL
jgi:HTH-type transcriptional regulator / antitoxin HigA